MATTTKKCHLLALPAELRNTIYDLAVTDHTVDIDKQKRAAPGLLLASRQTHAEANGAYRRNSNFTSKSPTLMRQFLERLESGKSRLISTATYDATRLNRIENGIEVFWAQEVIFRIARHLTEKNVVLARVDAIRVALSTAEGGVVSTAEPW
ncbi:hypothetical protein CLAFUR0_11919, partial [Fulvia fulva]